MSPARKRVPRPKKSSSRRRLPTPDQGFQQLFRSLDALLWYADLSSNILFINEAVERIYRRTAAEFRANPRLWLEAVHPQDQKRVAASDRTLRKVGHSSLRYRIKRPDGEVRWLHDSKRLLRNSRGIPFLMGGLAMDITAAVAAETSLAEFKFIAEQAPYGIGRIDLQGNLLYLNQAMARMHGRTVTELQGHHFSLCHTPEQMPAVEKNISEVRTRGSTAMVEIWHARKDGTVFPTLMTVWRVKGEKSEASSLAAVALDITNLRQAERALRESEERYRTLIDSMQEGLWAIDRDARTTFVNPAITRLMGYDTGEIVGRKVFDFIDARNAKIVAGQLRKRWKGASSEFELDFLRRDGTVMNALLKTTPLLKQGNVVGSFACISDLTERKKLERKLRQQDKLSAIGQLAGGVAHDFNNQLTGLISFVEQIEKRIRGDGTLEKYVGHIRTTAWKLADLTKKLLDFSCQRTYDRKPLDLHRVIDDVATIAEHTFDRRIVIEKDLAAPSAHVLGDAGSLENVLLNLALNARDAMPEGGRLVFSTRETDPPPEAKETASSLSPPGSRYLQVTVQDTGTGIDPKILPLIFEPFFTTKEPGKGTGMGLSAAYGTIHSHGGEISVENAPDGGVLVTILLPLTAVAPAENQAPPTPAPSTHTRKILLIDDEEILLQGISAGLQAAGFRVTTCARPSQARELYLRSWKRTDLVILDLIMPEMNGRQLFYLLREINPEIRALVCSGYALEEDQKLLQEKGIVGFLAKPFSLDTLVEKVNAALA